MLLTWAALRARHRAEGPAAAALLGPGLRAAAGRLRVGTAVDDAPLQADPGYRAELAREFSSLTPENAMKWAVLEPTRGKVDWAGADRLVDFAGDHDQAVRGHTLVWWNQNPAWVDALHGGALRAAVREHIGAVVGRYRGRVGMWDVVNEPFEDDGSRRLSTFQRELGDGWIEDALRTARAADPAARLFLNEIGAEGPGPKSDALYALVKDLRARGVPLDGVGFQFHLNLKGPPAGVRANLARFAALGVEVALTEVDVALRQPAGAADRRAQAAVFGTVVRSCRVVPRCAGVTFWGFTDRYSWIPGAQPGMGAATLLDAQLRPKPAYAAVLQALGDG